MKRENTKRIITLLTVLLLSFALMAATAQAEWRSIGSSQRDDGQEVDFFQDDITGDVVVWWWTSDKNYIEYDFTAKEWNDMTPADVDGTGTSSKEAMLEALKRIAQGSKGPGAKKTNPITNMRNAHGKGLAPIWNPPDVLRGAPGSPHSGKKKTPGSVKDQARRHGHSQKKNNTGKDHTLHPYTPGFGGMGTRDDNHPERVNPNPEMRTQSLKTKELKNPRSLSHLNGYNRNTWTISPHTTPLPTAQTLQVVQPISGKQYHGKALVEVVLPKTLKKDTTITFELLSRPTDKSKKKNSFSNSVFLFTKPVRKDEKPIGNSQKKIYTWIIADQVYRNIFHQQDIFFTSEFQVLAILNTSHQQTGHSTGWFRFSDSKRDLAKGYENNLGTTASVSLVDAPNDNVYATPAAVKVRTGHSFGGKMVMELQYNTCSIGKKYRDIHPGYTSNTIDETTTLYYYVLQQQGCYRVRGRDDIPGAGSSPWSYFKIHGNSIVGAPGSTLQVSAAPPKQIKPAAIMGQKSINPQPEPPGKQIHSISMPLVVIAHPRSFRPTESIKISVKNTPFSRLPFELRYRPAAGKPYRMVKQPDHSFNRKNGVTSLLLSLKQPGQYQVRFRANHKAPWTSWNSFQIMENPAKAAALAQKMRITPAAARMINPQPEPPGKMMHSNVAHHITSRTTKPKNHLSTGPGLTAAQIHIAPPQIRQLHNGRKFMLTGGKVHIKTKVEYAGREKIQVEVQQEKKKGRYVTIHPQTRLSRSGNITTTDIPLAATGNYRLRVRAGNKARWGNWITFTVDKLMKNMPTLSHPAPQIQTMSPAHKPGLSTKPELQRIR